MDPETLSSVWAIVTSVVTIGAALAALTKRPKQVGFWQSVRKFVDMIALNVGHATNKDAE